MPGADPTQGPAAAAAPDYGAYLLEGVEFPAWVHNPAYDADSHNAFVRMVRDWFGGVSSALSGVNARLLMLDTSVHNDLAQLREVSQTVTNRVIEEATGEFQRLRA